VTLELWPHNRAARRLYERAGFVEEGRRRRHYRRRSGELWDSVVMGLVLDETSPGSRFTGEE
jgi:putative acetyltransferase